MKDWRDLIANEDDRDSLTRIADHMMDVICAGRNREEASEIAYRVIELTEELSDEERWAVSVYSARRNDLSGKREFAIARKLLVDAGITPAKFIDMVRVHGSHADVSALHGNAPIREHGLLIRLLMKLGLK